MKVKNWAWDSATKFLSQIEDDLISLKITKSEALIKMQDSNEMLSLEGINSKSDAEEWVDNIHFQYNLVETTDEFGEPMDNEQMPASEGWSI